jgi:hypothetical protein
MNRRVFFLVTVDGDLRVGTPDQQRAGVLAMRGVHRQLGLFSRTTWMINELDFHWTQQHPELLLDLVASGECIGVHDHLDTHYAESYALALDLIRQSKSTLEGFYCRAGQLVSVRSHRNGCALQSEAWYRALKDVGYAEVSDVWPGVAWSGRMVCDGPPPNPWRRLEAGDPGAIAMDNLMIPLTALPWRHDPANWLDYHSRSGCFVQVPITSMPLVDRQRFEQAADSGQPLVFLLVDTHPYDMQDPSTGDVSPERLQEYKASLEWVRQTFQAELIRLDQVRGLLPS